MPASLTDRAELADLVSRLGRWLDDASTAAPADLLTDDVTVTTPGGQATGRDAVVAQALRTHAHVVTQHVITDVLADVEADSATVTANLLATFARETGPETLGERYAFTARRTGAGWRLRSIEVLPLWQRAA